MKSRLAMRTMIALILASNMPTLALADPITDPDLLRELNEPAPCKNGGDTCQPWEREWPRSSNRFAKYAQSDEPDLGPGPHTLIISDGSEMTRIDYKTGSACKSARDIVRKQTASPPSSASVIYGPSRTKAFCVPR